MKFNMYTNFWQSCSQRLCVCSGNGLMSLTRANHQRERSWNVVPFVVHDNNKNAFAISQMTYLLSPARKLRQGNVFTQVCLWFCSQMGLCPGGVSVWGVSVQRGLCPWGGCLCPGDLCQGDPRPLYGYVRAVRILLNALLLDLIFKLLTFWINDKGLYL